MLPWLALYVSSLYTAGLIIKKARNCLVTASAHAEPMSQQTMGSLPILQQPTQQVLTRFGRLGICLRPPHQQYSPHSTPTCSTQSKCHQPTSTCPCIQPASTSPMRCTQHLIITTAQPCLALKPPNPHTRNQNLVRAMALGHHVEQGASTCCPLPCSLIQLKQGDWVGPP